MNTAKKIGHAKSGAMKRGGTPLAPSPNAVRPRFFRDTNLVKDTTPDVGLKNVSEYKIVLNKTASRKRS